MITLDELLNRKETLLNELAEVRNEIKRLKGKPAAERINLARYREALHLRREGKIYREIGALLNITGNRARMMILRAERMTKAGTL